MTKVQYFNNQIAGIDKRLAKIGMKRPAIPLTNTAIMAKGIAGNTKALAITEYKEKLPKEYNSMGSVISCAEKVATKSSRTHDVFLALPDLLKIVRCRDLSSSDSEPLLSSGRVPLDTLAEEKDFVDAGGKSGSGGGLGKSGIPQK